MIGRTSGLTSMAMATRGGATGQSRLEKNSFQSTRPIISVSGPAEEFGDDELADRGTKTSMKPAITPGIESGSVMWKKVASGGAAEVGARGLEQGSSSFTRLA